MSATFNNRDSGRTVEVNKTLEVNLYWHNKTEKWVAVDDLGGIAQSNTKDEAVEQLMDSYVEDGYEWRVR